MNKRKLIQHHKWFGLLISFFLLMFCVSGILLNHRQLISDINVSRTLLSPLGFAAARCCPRATSIASGTAD